MAYLLNDTMEYEFISKPLIQSNNYERINKNEINLNANAVQNMYTNY